MNLEKEFDKASKVLKKAGQKDDNVTYIILASDGEKGFSNARMSRKDLAYLIAGNEGLKDLIEDALFLVDLLALDGTDKDTSDED